MILGVARVAGETAPLLFTSLQQSVLEFGLESSRPPRLPVMIYTYAISPYDDWHRQAWAAGLVLLGLVLIANIGGAWVLFPGAYPFKEGKLSMSAESPIECFHYDEQRLKNPGPRRAACAQEALWLAKRLKMSASELNFFYGELSGAARYQPGIPDRKYHRADRTFRLRQDPPFCER